MKKIFLMASMFVLAISSGAFAHIPNIIPHDTTTNYAVAINAPIEKSVAYYASFEFAGDVDTYGFTLSASDFDSSLTLTDISSVVHNLVVDNAKGVPGRTLHVGSLVPACAVYKNILPIVAIVGPLQDSLPAYDGSIALPTGVTIAKNQGVLFLNNTIQGAIWYEKFTYKSYFYQKRTDIIITEQGDYRVYIWDKNKNKGDYVVEVGPIEVFGFAEIMQTLFWVEHIVYDGEISNSTCISQLKTLDGANPTVTKMISDYSKMFGS